MILTYMHAKTLRKKLSTINASAKTELDAHKKLEFTLEESKLIYEFIKFREMYNQNLPKSLIYKQEKIVDALYDKELYSPNFQAYFERARNSLKKELEYNT